MAMIDYTEQRFIYVIGSLRNPQVQETARKLRELFPDAVVFDDWSAAGPEADDYWREYEIARGHDFVEALNGSAAKHVFYYDKTHLDMATDVVLVAPAGKSGHMELGYAIGRGCRGYYLVDPNVERYDVMLQFAMPCRDLDELFEHLQNKLQWNHEERSGGLV